MKNILLIATGGTIAATQTEAGLAPGVSSSQLLQSIPDVKELCNVETMQLLNIDSTNIQPEQWLLIARAVEDNYDRFDGFVITHGTDTMAYTCAALSYLIQRPDKPIVLTGSQKPIGMAVSDARKNLMDSFRFCCRDDVRGVYLVFDGKAIVGTRARKVKSKSYSAFESINFPVAAFIDDRRIVHYIPPEQTLTAQGPEFFHSIYTGIFLLKLIPGMEPDVLDYAAGRYDVIIIESYGVGGLPFADERNFLEKVKTLSDMGKIIVVSTQVMLEGSDMGVYEVGMRAMRSAPLLQTFDMTLETAVAKLMWILGVTREPAEIKRMFYRPVNHDISISE